MRQIGEKSKLISVCSLFFVTFKDGIDQLFEVLQSEEFAFVVKDEERKITIDANEMGDCKMLVVKWRTWYADS
jgi:hypothetical protein